MFDPALQLLLRTGIQRSKKAPSALHPYGYMKDKFVWSLISAVGIFCLGAGVTVVHGFHGLFVQTQLEHLTAGLTGQRCKQNAFDGTMAVLLVLLISTAPAFILCW